MMTSGMAVGQGTHGTLRSFQRVHQLVLLHAPQLVFSNFELGNIFHFFYFFPTNFLFGVHLAQQLHMVLFIGTSRLCICIGNFHFYASVFLITICLNPCHRFFLKEGKKGKLKLALLELKIYLFHHRYGSICNWF